MAKGKNYGPDFLGRPRMRQSKHPHLEVGFGPYFGNKQPQFPLSFDGLPLMSPLETALFQHLLQMPEVSFRLPDQMSETDFLPIAVICERLEDQTNLIMELGRQVTHYRERLEILPEVSNVRLHFFPMDQMDRMGAQSGHSAEELVDFTLSQIYETFQDQTVIALTVPSQQLLAVLKERATDYPDRGQRFLTLEDALGAGDEELGDIARSDVRERYVDAVLRQVFRS